MTVRSTMGLVIAAVLVVAVAAGFPFLKRFRSTALSPGELTLKGPKPPLSFDDPCLAARGTLADPAKPTREDDSLSADELAIYKAVIDGWNGRSRTPLNVADETMPLDREISNCECLRGIDLESLAKATHSFRGLTREVVASRLARLVKAKLQAERVRATDPSDTIREGRSVKAAVDEAFDNGLFRLSEIAFDREHRRALVGFSFVCGSLCGSGHVWLFEKVNGAWKKLEPMCGGWIS